MTDETPTPNINISAPGYLFPTTFLWAVAAPCTMAVCKYTIAPYLTWWDVTMPLWGLPAVLVGSLASAVALVVAVVLLMAGTVAAVALPIFLWAGLKVFFSAVWGWSENWRYARNEARVSIDRVKIAGEMTNRIKQEFASLGANDVSLKCETVDLGVKACISLRVDDKREMAGNCSWSLMDAEGKPPKFFSNELTSMILSVRKRVKEERAKS